MILYKAILLSVCIASSMSAIAEGVKSDEERDYLNKIVFHPDEVIGEAERKDIQKIFNILFPGEKLHSVSALGAQELFNQLLMLSACKKNVVSTMDEFKKLKGIAYRRAVINGYASLLADAGSVVGQKSCVALIQTRKNVIGIAMNDSHI